MYNNVREEGLPHPEKFLFYFACHRDYARVMRSVSPDSQLDGLLNYTEGLILVRLDHSIVTANSLFSAR